MLALILIGINVLCIVIEIMIVVVVDCGTYERCTGTGGNGDVDGDDSSVVGSSEIVKVFDPASDNFLSRTKTFALVKKAVDHDKVLKIQDIHRASKNRLEKRIQEQESRANARVRKRLSNKRKKKSAQNQQTKVRQVEPVAMAVV